MELTEVMKMSDLLLGKLNEDAAGAADGQASDDGFSDEAADNSLEKPLKQQIDNNRQAELDVEMKIKKLKASKQVVQDPEKMAQIEQTIKVLQAKQSELKAGRKKAKNSLNTMKEEAESTNDTNDDLSDNDMTTIASDCDKDISDDSKSKDSVKTEAVDPSIVEKTKLNAVIQQCNIQKDKIETLAEKKIDAIKQLQKRKIAQIDQKEQAAKDMKDRIQAQADQDKAAEDTSEAQDDTGGDTMGEQVIADQKAQSQQINEAFEKIRSILINNKAQRLNDKAKKLKMKRNENNKDRIDKQLFKIDQTLINLVGVDSDGNRVTDDRFASTKLGKLSKDENSRESVHNKYHTGIFDSVEIENVIASSDSLIEELEQEEKASAKPEVAPVEKKECPLCGQAKEIYDSIVSGAPCTDAICEKIKASPDGSAIISSLQAELSKPEPDMKVIAPLKIRLEKLYKYFKSSETDK